MKYLMNDYDDLDKITLWYITTSIVFDSIQTFLFVCC